MSDKVPPLGMDWGLPRQEPIRASVRSNDAMLQLECAACQEQYYSLMVIAACGVPELTDQLSLGVKSILSVDHWSIHPFLRSGSMSCLSVLANHVAYTVDRGTATVISK